MPFGRALANEGMAVAVDREKAAKTEMALNPLILLATDAEATVGSELGVEWEC